MDASAQKWDLTRRGFDALLGRLDPDREKAAREYELIRSKLINYFDWRDCPFPEEHADEAMNRLTRKVESGEEFRDLSTYVFGIARMMVLEIGRSKERQLASIELASQAKAADPEPDTAEEQKVDCLKHCLASLSERSRELITEYYQDTGAAKIERRKDLASRLGLQLNALRIRACRVRAKLEECMELCLKGNSKNEILQNAATVVHEGGHV